MELPTRPPQWPPRDQQRNDIEGAEEGLRTNKKKRILGIYNLSNKEFTEYELKVLDLGLNMPQIKVLTNSKFLLIHRNL